MSAPTTTVYERVGGLPFFERLVDRFYEGVAGDPVLLRLYPHPEDLRPAPTPLAVPGSVLGRAHDLLPRARASEAPDTSRPVRDRSGGTRPLARPYAGGGRVAGPSAGHPTRARGVFRDGRRVDAEPLLSLGSAEPRRDRAHPTGLIVLD